MKTVRRCAAVLLLLAVVLFAGCEKLTIKKLRDPSETTVPAKLDSPQESLPNGESEETEPEKTEPPEVDPIYGQWCMDVNLNEYMAYFFEETYGDILETPDEDLYFTFIIEFKEPDVFMFSVDADEDSFEDYMYAFKPILKEYMYDMAAEEGISRKEYNEMCLEETGMDLNDYLDEMLEEAVDQAMDQFAEASYQGFFCVEDDELYTADRRSELKDFPANTLLSVEKDTLEITAKAMDEEEEEMLEMFEAAGLGFPWKFKRQYSF